MIRKTFLTAITMIFALAIHAQNDTMYIMKDGFVINKQPITSSYIDSIVFYKPITTVEDVDGNSYNTIKIGSKTWMKENLKVTKFNDGTPIQLVENDNNLWSNMATPAFAWAYNWGPDTLDHITGAYYNGFTVASSKNVCPVGWHVPLRTEWVALLYYLTANGYAFDGSTSTINGFKVAKAISYAKNGGWWINSTTPGAPGNNDFIDKQNASRFSGNASGLRDSIGDFSSYSERIYFWAKDNSGNNGNTFYILYDSATVQEAVMPKQSGLSIRCVKD